jgi:predicted glutamine amidotransferase
MCRLYGFRASEPTKVECSLVYAQNALLHQSALDRRGLSHSDGWGISYYANALPVVERRDTAAHEGEYFSLAAERVYAKTVLAHVRAATVGAHSVVNTHPFVYGGWSFAHNGTVRGFDVLRGQLERETDPSLSARRRGDTDSEAAFYWLLTRLQREGISLASRATALEPLIRLFAEAVRELDARCARADGRRPARLNFVLTNGPIMVASRLRNSLSWLLRDGIRDCEICGIPHVHHATGEQYRAVVVASEPISHEEWREVPEGSIVAVDQDLAASVHAM